jgi:hypothetical protein
VSAERQRARLADAPRVDGQEEVPDLFRRYVGAREGTPVNRRDAYADVGAAIRQASARAAELRASAKCYRALLGVIEAVSSWSRLEDRIAVYKNETTAGESIAERQNLDNTDAGKALRWLAENGVIVYEPTRGRGRRSLVGLPREGDHGRYTPPGKAGRSALLSAAQMPESANAKAGRFDPEKQGDSAGKAGRSALPTEKCPEDPEDVSPRDPSCSDAVEPDGSPLDHPTNGDDSMQIPEDLTLGEALGDLAALLPEDARSRAADLWQTTGGRYVVARAARNANESGIVDEAKPREFVEWLDDPFGESRAAEEGAF